MERTRVKTEASDNIYSMTHRNALAIWERRIYIKSLLWKKTRMCITETGHTGTKDTRHPLKNPSQAPTGEEAQPEYRCLDTKSRSDISNTYSPKTLSEKVVQVSEQDPNVLWSQLIQLASVDEIGSYLGKPKAGLRIYLVRQIAQLGYPNSMFDAGRMQIHDDPLCV